jgi:hypothetical protein
MKKHVRRCSNCQLSNFMLVESVKTELKFVVTWRPKIETLIILIAVIEEPFGRVALIH